MRLDVLGSSGSHTGPDAVCSGYLLRTATTTVVLDAGNGSTARLQGLVDLADVDAFVVSHGHVDHCVDLIGLHYALRTRGGPRLPLHAPAGAVDALAAVAGREAPWGFEDSFAVHEVAAGDRLAVGDLEVAFHHAVHTVPAVSTRLTDGTSTLTYSGDCAGGDDLVAAAAGADVLLCEATWQGDPDAHPPGIHLTARGAGHHATRAGVGRLLLTHVQGGLDREVSAREARSTFAGEVVAVRDGDVHHVGA